MTQMIPITAGHVKPTFNVVISNVPGPEEARYFRGADHVLPYHVTLQVHPILNSKRG